MNARTRAKAARLYSLALLANGDSGGADTEEQADVMRLSRDVAAQRLEREGYDPHQLLTIQACIDAAAMEAARRAALTPQASL